MKFNFLICLIVMVSQAMAYIPTVESIFRNGASLDTTNNTVAATLKISKKSAAEDSSSQLMSVSFPPQLTKLYIANDQAGRAKMVQVNYSSSLAKKSEINSVLYRPEFEYGKMGFKSEENSTKMFYAVLASVLNNDGEMLVKFLQEQGVPVKLNSEIINREKLALLQRYAEYLKLKSSDDNMKNPLKSEDAEKQIQINELMKSSFYLKSPFVSKVRDGEEFYWQIKSSNFEARLKDESRHIQFIKLQSTTGEIKFLFSDYIIASDKFEVPRKITIVEAGQDVFEIEIQKVEIFTERGDSFSTRLKDLTEEKNKNNLGRTYKPPFLL